MWPDGTSSSKKFLDHFELYDPECKFSERWVFESEASKVLLRWILAGFLFETIFLSFFKKRLWQNRSIEELKTKENYTTDDGILLMTIAIEIL